MGTQNPKRKEFLQVAVTIAVIFMVVCCVAIVLGVAVSSYRHANGRPFQPVLDDEVPESKPEPRPRTDYKSLRYFGEVGAPFEVPSSIRVNPRIVDPSEIPFAFVVVMEVTNSRMSGNVAEFELKDEYGNTGTVEIALPPAGDPTRAQFESHIRAGVSQFHYRFPADPQGDNVDFDVAAVSLVLGDGRIVNIRRSPSR